jgi:6-phosphogluconolactonase
MKTDIRIFKDKDTLSHAAADIFAEAATQAIETRGRFLAALSGGSTPSRLYRLLAGKSYRDRIEWDKVCLFWGDERCVPPDDPGSNYGQVRGILLDQIHIPKKNVLRIKGELEPAEASKDYSRTLKAFADPNLDWPRFDLVLMGMGEDGHTASLFPGSEVDTDSATLAVTAHYQGRPANRVTLTPLVFNAARNTLFLVTGANKAFTLAKVINGIQQPKMFPAQRIHPEDGRVIWLVDEAAGKELT